MCLWSAHLIQLFYLSLLSATAIVLREVFLLQADMNRENEYPPLAIRTAHWVGLSKSTPETPLLSASTDMTVELSRLDRSNPFWETAERRFRESWNDRTKTCRLEGIILFDIKSSPRHINGEAPGTSNLASHDDELLRLLGDFPLRFHGAPRACHIGDPGHSENLCGNSGCGICSVFHAQFANRQAGKSFESSPRIVTSPRSYQADEFAKSQHIRSSQHAMILCACPNIAQSDTQVTNSDAPSYKASGFRRTLAVPIGLIMYTRRG